MSPTRPDPALSPPGESGRLPDVVQLFLFESPRLALVSYFGPICVGIMNPFLSFHFCVADPPRASLEPAGRVGSTPRCRASFSFRITSPHVNSIFQPDSRVFHNLFLRFSPTGPEPALSQPTQAANPLGVPSTQGVKPPGVSTHPGCHPTRVANPPEMQPTRGVVP